MASKAGYAGPPAKQKKKNTSVQRRQAPRQQYRRPAVHQEKRRNREHSLSRYSDYSLILVVLFLLAFGLIMLYSTSSYEAALEYDGQADYYVVRQLRATLLGLILMAIVTFIPYRWWNSMALPVYLVATLLILLIIPFGREVNGAKRWLYIGPISVQPAEISKIAVIVLTARILTKIPKKKLRKWRTLFLVLLPAIVQGLMLWQITDNLSSAIIVIAIAVCMLFIVIKDYWRYLILIIGVACAGFGWLYYATHTDSEMGFRSERLLVWLDPEKYADGKGFQTLQALYGIGSGGMFGKGLGQSMQKLGYIPEAQNDMIFSIICEELGVFGAVSVIMLFVILCWRLMLVASNAEDMFGGLIVIGVMTQIAVQVILNIAVVTNTIPNTGVSLPFISYGGSSVVLLLVEIGMCLNVARSIRLRELK